MTDLLRLINSLNPMGFFDLAPVCQAHGVNLAIDNMGGDSDGAGYSVLVVTPSTDAETKFAGPKLDVGHEGSFPNPVEVGRFLSQHNVQAVFCTADELTYTVVDYVQLLEDMASDSQE